MINKIQIKITFASLILGLLFFVSESCNSAEDPALTPIITSFSPESGSSRTTVTINGKNFHPSTVDNVVKFNEVDAPVIFATRAQLIVNVPQQAITGRISVTVAEKTAISSIDFVIPNSPKILEVSPNYGSIGAAIEITGFSFSEIPEENDVRFNGIKATIFSAAPMRLVVVVPEEAVTGKISVTTNQGTAISESDFTIEH